MAYENQFPLIRSGYEKPHISVGNSFVKSVDFSFQFVGVPSLHRVEAMLRNIPNKFSQAFGQKIHTEKDGEMLKTAICSYEV